MGYDKEDVASYADAQLLKYLIDETIDNERNRISDKLTRAETKILNALDNVY
jgi:hypothetical protein